MSINIFATQGTDPKIARWRHVMTLVAAVLINVVLWILQDIEFISSADPSFRREVILTIMWQGALEALVLMEITLLFSRLVIWLFRGTKHTFWNIFLQCFILWVFVVAISFMIGIFYMKMVWPDDDMYVRSLATDGLTAYFLVSIYFISYLMNRYRDQADLALKAEMQALRQKTDNHFIFNTFTTLCGLIETDSPKALDFTERMSHTYRYIVANGDKALVPLRQELEYLEDYRQLMAIRYDAVSINVGESVKGEGYLIPPLSLQGLLENAIKHNAHSKGNPLVVDITMEGGYLVITNNRNPLSAKVPSTGKGLENLSERFRLVQDREVVIKESDDRFTVQLPLIRKEDVYEGIDY